MTIPIVSNGIKELFTKSGLRMFVDWLIDLPKYDGKPQHLTDAAAGLDTIYFSTTANKLVYKDDSGVVHNLY